MLETQLTQAFQRSFGANANAADVPAMRAYMRELFPFLGLKTPQRRQLTRDVLEVCGTPESETLRTAATELWALLEREYQYAALDLLFEAELTCEDLPLLERLILDKPWWDTVDALARLVGRAFQHDLPCRDHWLARWRASDSLWLHRSTLLFQLAYKADTDTALLFELVQEHAQSPEFFIQKASGWALREYAKTQPEAVYAFIRSTALAPRTRREALKHAPKG